MYLNEQELKEIGFASYGKRVMISTKASIYGAKNIHLGDNIRVDDFAIISAGEGGIFIGSHVHIAVGALLIGSGRMELHDFVGISSKASIYSSNDDYSGNFLSGPTIPDRYKNVTNSPVTIGRHTIVGSGCVVLPNVVIGEVCSIGALSLVTRNCEPFGIYVGVPAKFIKKRSDNLLQLERQFLKDWDNGLIV
jgi:galactoside O-acetyltransferase